MSGPYCGAATDPGRERTHNEDAWRVCDDGRLLLLADGMGGYNAGEVAAGIAVDTLSSALDGWQPTGASAHPAAREQVLRKAIGAANAAILAAAARRPECLGMGTTLVCVWLDEHSATIAHVGDSRVYLWRDGRLTRLTRDHSVSQAMVDAGLLDEYDDRPGRRPVLRGVLTRALGVEPLVEPDLSHIDWRDGDRLILCSDGLTDLVDDGFIRECLGRGDDAVVCARTLLAAALAAGGHDNVTVLTAFLTRAPREEADRDG
jgi:serine/threonine protein phosphatase PrpC